MGSGSGFLFALCDVMHPFAAVDAPEGDWGLCQVLDGDAQAEHLVRHLKDKAEQAHQRQLHAPEREVVDEQRGAYVAAAAQHTHDHRGRKAVEGHHTRVAVHHDRAHRRRARREGEKRQHIRPEQRKKGQKLHAAKGEREEKCREAHGLADAHDALVAAADAGFGNIWSLQDCIETLYEFGNEDQHSRFIPRICAGETMSMDLTEPDAGSDLQSVMLKATFDEKENCWRLNGVKRFITNGDADLHLVLARSEEGTRDGRGLSMFIYDKREGGVDVRRIENKLGIHGSPTCELVYKNAKAELCGDRKLGLIKYVMALMNGARLGIAAQSVGLSQAAYNEGLAYAKDRKQFNKAIIEFPAVYDMLAIMKAKLDAGRALLYQTSRYVDTVSYTHLTLPTNSLV